MKIELSRKEYRTLLEMAEIGHWIIASYPHEPEDELPDVKPYQEMEQKLLALAEDFGSEHLVDSTDEEGIRQPTQAFEELFLQFVDLFCEESFWDELLLRVVDREMVRRFGVDGLEKASNEELEEVENEISERYVRELEANGIERFEIAAESTPLKSHPKSTKTPRNGSASKGKPRKKK